MGEAQKPLCSKEHESHGFKEIENGSLHIPVMVEEVVRFLLSSGYSSGERLYFFDGTIGSGGYTEALLKATSPGGIVIGVDKDPYAIERCKRRLETYVRQERLYLFHADFRYVDRIIRNVGIEMVHGAVLDLGMSSDQLGDPERGFSFMSDGPLDMRMNPQDHLTAAHVVNNLSEHELARIFFEYGEERYARKIAAAIVTRRKHTPISRTQELVDIVMSAIPRKESRSRIHPATRVFQALRIYVNDELGALRDFLGKALDVLAPEGVLCIVSFHSLEDRMVKKAFKSWANPCSCPPEAPLCTCGNRPGVRILTRKALFPSPEEVRRNPRARSARLRAIQKIG